MADRIRIGFIGAGTMGQCAHLRNYAAVDECDVVALAELRADTAARVAARYAIPNVYSDHEEMLAKEELDAVVVSQPFNRHGILVPGLRDRGLPVFTEKPLSASIEVGRRICEADAANDGFLMVGYHKRSDPATMRAKAEVEELKASGEIGAMTYIRITMPPGDWVAGGFDCLIRGDDPPPELARDAPPGDMDEETRDQYIAFVNYYIHQVNLLRHFLGEDYTVKYADAAGTLLVAESESGVSGVIEMSPYSTSLDWQEEALICFERGYVKIALPAPLAYNRAGSVTVFKDPADGAAPCTVCPQLPYVHAMRQQALNFMAAVRGECPPMCDAATALKDLQVAREYISLIKKGEEMDHA